MHLFGHIGSREGLGAYDMHAFELDCPISFLTRRCLKQGIARVAVRGRSP